MRNGLLDLPLVVILMAPAAADTEDARPGACGPAPRLLDEHRPHNAKPNQSVSSGLQLVPPAPLFLGFRPNPPTQDMNVPSPQNKAEARHGITPAGARRRAS